MNQDRQDSSPENAPASVPEQPTTIESPIENQFASTTEVSSSISQVRNFQTTAPDHIVSSSGNSPPSAPIQPEIIVNFAGYQFAFTSQVLHSLQEGHIKSIPLHCPTSFSVITASLAEQPVYHSQQQDCHTDQFASTSDASTSLFQQTTNFQKIAPRNTASVSRNTLASIKNYLRRKLQPASTSEASTSLFQPTSFSVITPAPVAEQPVYHSQQQDCHTDKFTSTSDASTSLFQQTTHFRKIAPRNTASVSGNTLASIKKHPRRKFKLASTSEASTSHSLQRISEVTRDFPLLVSQLETPCQQNLQTSASGEQVTTTLSSQMTVALPSSTELTSPSKVQTTAVSPGENTGALTSSFELTPPSKTRATSARPKQRKDAPSEKQATIIRPIQKTGILPPSVEKTPSIKKATTAGSKSRTSSLSASAEKPSTSKERAKAVRSRRRSKTLSPSINTTSTSRREVIYVTSRRLTWPTTIAGEPEIEVGNKITHRHEENQNPILVDLKFSESEKTTDPCHVRKESPETPGGKSSISQQQPSTSSLESPSKNRSTEHSISIKETESNVKQIDGRLVLFDKFMCVNCLAVFATQDELLNHEPIHFND